MRWTESRRHWRSALMILGLLLGTPHVHAEPSTSQQPLVLDNGKLHVSIESSAGARSGTFRSLTHDYDFVLQWKQSQNQKGAAHHQGGIFAGAMSGTYHSAQFNSPYDIVESSEEAATLRYEHQAPLLAGLEETRSITLDDQAPRATMKLVITNTADEPRTVNYRLQDWIGTGQKRGRDSVYVLPQANESSPDVFMLAAADQGMNHFDFDPEQPWYAIVDLVADVGLLVRVEGSPVEGAFFWGSPSTTQSRTAELFLPRHTLAPQEQWQVTVHYQVFTPSAPNTGDSQIDVALSRRTLETELARRSSPAPRPLPYHARLTMPIHAPALTLMPVHPTSEAMLDDDAASHDSQLTLDDITVVGTPGEVVPVAFRMLAQREVRSGTVKLTHLQGKAGTIDRNAFDPRYVADRHLYLMRDWQLARNVPDEMALINNDLRGADELTPFTLQADQSELVWVYLRVPEDAAAGHYRGQCIVEAGGDEPMSFDIGLTVRPFTLQRPAHKNYGSFFRYYLPGDADPEAEQPRSGLVSREAYRAALEKLDDVGYDSLVIYTGAREDLLWVLDQCVELGWTHGTFVLINPWSLTPEELEARYGAYDMTFLGWGVDEPSEESDIPKTISRYDRLIKHGYTPAFTPNVPLGLIIADALEQSAPIIALSGNGPYAFDITRQYRDQGRQVYWYNTGMGQPALGKRLVRGVYLWKEPVNGIIDWGEDAAAPRISSHQSAGFIGDQTVPTVGRENVRQALIDLCYLYTLEQHIKKSSNAAAVQEGEALLQWVRQRFHGDWHEVAREFGSPVHLDMLRERISACIATLQEPS